MRNTALYHYIYIVVKSSLAIYIYIYVCYYGIYIGNKVNYLDYCVNKAIRVR